MVPYFEEPVLHAGPFTLHAFTILLILAVLGGGFVILERAARLKIDHDRMFGMSFCAFTCGLAGAHVAKLALDYTSMFFADPLVIVKTSRGIRSLGGLVGGLLGAAGYGRIRRIPPMETFRMLDVIAYALPFAWLIGRLGCFLAHDHRGNYSSNWIAVRFPEGARYDLGLIEFLFLIGLCALFHWLDRKPRPVGLFFSLFGFIYGAFRVWLDTLHNQPFRFWGGVLGILVGLAGWVTMRQIDSDQHEHACSPIQSAPGDW